MRDIAPATLAAMSGRVVRPVGLLWLDWPGGAVRAHDRTGDIVLDGQIFTGVGQYGEISGIAEDSALAVREVTLSLAAPLAAQAAEIVARPQIRNRPGKIWLGSLAEDNRTLAAPPVVIFDGVMRAANFTMSKVGDAGSVEHRIAVTCQVWFWNVRAKRTYRHDHSSLAALTEQILTWPEQ